MSDVDFGLSDDEFWSNPGKEPPRRGPLPSIPATSGLELAAPSFASVTGRETLPLVARFTATHEELARVSFARSALITVVDLDRNSFYCGFACDQDCTDVDLFVEDSRGQQIGQDIALDDHPFIELTPGRDEQFTVRIRLVNCEVEPCYVAGRVLQQGR